MMDDNAFKTAKLLIERVQYDDSGQGTGLGIDEEKLIQWHLSRKFYELRTDADYALEKMKTKEVLRQLVEVRREVPILRIQDES